MFPFAVAPGLGCTFPFVAHLERGTGIRNQLKNAF